MIKEAESKVSKENRLSTGFRWKKRRRFRGKKMERVVEKER